MNTGKYGRKVKKKRKREEIVVEAKEEEKWSELGRRNRIHQEEIDFGWRNL